MGRQTMAIVAVSAAMLSTGFGVDSGVAWGTKGTAAAHARMTRMISVGDEFACALLASGRVDCWGANEDGQLGDGTTDGPTKCDRVVPCSRTPVRVRGVGNAIAVSAGAGEACALIAGGRVDCWGWSSSGSLGDGSGRGPDTCDPGYVHAPCSPEAIRVRGIDEAAAISVGDAFACALLASGHVDCWGENSYLLAPDKRTAEDQNGRADEDAAGSGKWFLGSDRAGWMVSDAPDGEGVKVVCEDCPSGPGLHPRVALQSAAAQPVAALEVADATLRARAVTPQAPLGPPRTGLLAASDEGALGLEVQKRPAGGIGLEPAIECDLARTQAQPIEFFDARRQQIALLGVANLT